MMMQADNKPSRKHWLIRRVHFLHATRRTRQLNVCYMNPRSRPSCSMCSANKRAQGSICSGYYARWACTTCASSCARAKSGQSPESKPSATVTLTTTIPQSSYRAAAYATLTSAICSYEQIQALNTGRHGLDMIIKANERLMTCPTLLGFSCSMISKNSGLLSSEVDGFICTRKRDQSSGAVQIIASTPTLYNTFRQLAP